MQLVTDVHNVIVGNKIDFNRDEEAKQKELNWRIKNLDQKLREIELTIEQLVFEVWQTDKPIEL